LKEKERVILFCSFEKPSTLAIFKEDGVFFTDKRIAAYLQVNDSIHDFTYFTFYKDICKMEYFPFTGPLWGHYSSIIITRCDGTSYEVNTYWDHGDSFFERLNKLWAATPGIHCDTITCRRLLK